MNDANQERARPQIDRQLDELSAELGASDLDDHVAAEKMAKARKVLGLLQRVKKAKIPVPGRVADWAETVGDPTEATPRDAGAVDETDAADCETDWPTSVPLDRQRVIGRFLIKQQIGQGGYGLVFLARDPSLDRDVALKIPRPQVIMTDAGRARFLREAKAAASLAHPNIVPVFESGDDGPVCFIAYEFIQGPRWPTSIGL